MTGHGITQAWHASERVLVGFDSRPHTRQVLRDAWRLAHGLRADLIAVFIQPEGYMAFSSQLVRLLKHGNGIKRYLEQAQQRLEEHALLAEDLGAEVIRTSSRDIAAKLIEIAKERHVTQIVLGQPARSRWEEILRGSTVNRLLRLNAEIDIHLVPGSRGQEE
jgi:two-component system sensor histidine kinase KdpD